MRGINFECGDARELGNERVMQPVDDVGLVRIASVIGEWQNGNAVAP